MMDAANPAVDSPPIVVHTVKFSLSISCKLLKGQAALKSPFFRLQFVNGDNIVTAPVGTSAPTGPAWISLDAPAGEVKKEVAAKAGAAASKAPSKGPAPIVPDVIEVAEPARFEWKKDYEPLDINDAFALRLNANPFLQVVLADEASPGASVETDPSASLRPRAFVALHYFDLSPLFNGETALTSEWLHDDTSLASATDPFNSAPDGIACLAITVRLDRPLLSEAMRMRLNPLSVEIQKVANLPGITIDPAVKSQHKFVHPDKFAVLQKLAVPVYASFTLFETMAPRSFRTRGVAHGTNKVKWRETTVFLASAFEKDALAAALETVPLRVELHDRDLLQSAAEHMEYIAQLNQLVEPNATGAEACMSILDADKEALKLWQRGLATCGDVFTHGVATVSLARLLSRADDLREGFRLAGGAASKSTPPRVSFSVSEPVIPSKRRVFPKGGLNIFDLTEEGVIARQPGGYLISETTLRVSVSLYHSIHLDIPATEAPAPCIFERAIFHFEYNNTPMLQAILSAMNKVNSTALPGVSLRSYQLTKEQKSAAEDGSLDVLSGFQVVDDEFRLIVVEGLAAKGMREIAAAVPRSSANDSKTKILLNPDVRFASRVYTDFDVSLKLLRLRNPLGQIMKSPEIYNRAKVLVECFSALDKMYSIRKKVSRLRVAKALDLFPSVASLLGIESKYGETISMADMNGIDPAAVTHAVSEEKAIEAVLAQSNAREDNRYHVKGRWKADTDCSNESFTATLHHRAALPPTDLLGERHAKSVEFRRTAHDRFLKHMKDTEGTEPVYIYSGQKLSQVALLKEAQRKRLAADTTAVYTYSTEYQSQTVDTVNMDEVKQLQEAKERSKWTTKGGFQYPAPKDPSEYAKLANDVSDSRKEALSYPWDEFALRPRRAASSRRRPDDHRPEFDSIPTNDTIFGGFKSDSITGGHRTVSMEKDPNYFTSVHLSDAGLVAEMKAAKKKEQEEWRSKVVVEDVDFKAHFGTKTPSQADRFEGILKEPPKKKALRMMQSVKLPSGKRVPLTTPPVNMFMRSMYETPKDFTTTLKPNDPAHFKGTDPVTKEPVDFVKFIHPSLLKSAARRIVYKREIVPLKPSEKAGPKWYPAKSV